MLNHPLNLIIDLKTCRCRSATISRLLQRAEGTLDAPFKRGIFVNCRRLGESVVHEWRMMRRWRPHRVADEQPPFCVVAGRPAGETRGSSSWNVEGRQSGTHCTLPNGRRVGVGTATRRIGRSCLMVEACGDRIGLTFWFS
jgi:hypothetical protein